MARIKYKEAAGIYVKRGRPAEAKKPSKTEIKKLYEKESKSIREVAKILGCSKDMIYRTLKENEINLREGYRRSKLRNIDKYFLKKEVKEKGITKVAKELSVDIRTLNKYLIQEK